MAPVGIGVAPSYRQARGAAGLPRLRDLRTGNQAYWILYLGRVTVLIRIQHADRCAHLGLGRGRSGRRDGDLLRSVCVARVISTCALPEEPTKTSLLVVDWKVGAIARTW